MKTQKKKLTVVMDADLYTAAQFKCDRYFGIGLSPLIKVFLKSFITQGGVGFYVGDDNLCKLFAKWLTKKQLDQGKKKGGTHLYGPKLKDLYQLGDTGKLFR